MKSLFTFSSAVSLLQPDIGRSQGTIGFSRSSRRRMKRYCSSGLQLVHMNIRSHWLWFTLSLCSELPKTTVEMNLTSAMRSAHRYWCTCWRLMYNSFLLHTLSASHGKTTQVWPGLFACVGFVFYFSFFSWEVCCHAFIYSVSLIRVSCVGCLVQHCQILPSVWHSGSTAHVAGGSADQSLASPAHMHCSVTKS